jgi:hypothetical protein
LPILVREKASAQVASAGASSADSLAK